VESRKIILLEQQFLLRIQEFLELKSILLKKIIKLQALCLWPRVQEPYLVEFKNRKLPIIRIKVLVKNLQNKLLLVPNFVRIYKNSLIALVDSKVPTLSRS
jgi:hypothetical protein